MASMSVSAATPTSPSAVPATKAATTKPAGDVKAADATKTSDAKSGETPAADASAESTSAAPAAGGAQPSNAPPYATSASLYVGELDPDVSEAQLFELFNHIGPVASIRVCRDAVTRRSLGYAYVNFHNMADAERAMETFNYQPIKNKPCRIMWSQRDPALRKGGSGNIFIKNLDRMVDNKALHDTFAAFGNILSCKVATDENGESRGHGFVHYETQEAADNAIKHVNGMLLNDKKVYVGAHVPKRERDSQVEAAKRTFTNVYVKNLEESITEEELREMFAKFGSLTSVALSRDDQEKSRGFAFVNFQNHDEAEKACEEMNGKEVKGKALFVSRAQKKAEREEELRRKFEAAKQEKMNKFAGVNLYVKNLTDKMDDDMLRSEFANYGTITSAKIMVDDKGNSKGFGFVCFSSADEATRAVTEMNQRMFDNKPMYVALAQRKDQRKQQLEQQYAARSGVRGMQQPMIPGVTMPYGMPYYPGGPGMPQVGRQPMMYPPQMAGMPRPRFPAGPGGPGGVRPMPGMAFPQMPGGMPFMAGPQVMPAGARGAQRGARPGQMPGQPGMPMGGQPNVGSPQQGGMNPAAAAAAQQARRGNYKFTSTARNNGGREVMPHGGANAAGANAAEGGEVSITSMLASMPLAQQKQTLGERLYPAVQTDLNERGKRELAGKITGMLLEMDNGELLHLLEEDTALKEKIGEALDVLDRHQAKLQEQQSAKAE